MLLNLILITSLLLKFTRAHFTFETKLGNLDVYLNGRKVFTHTNTEPALQIGSGKSKYNMNHGNFDVIEDLHAKETLYNFIIEEKNPEDSNKSPFVVNFKSKNGEKSVSILFDECKNGDEVCEKYTRRSSLDGVHYFKVTDVADKSVNRLWLKLFAEAKEHIYGGGEQYSHFSLKGHNYPIWAREQGVGRNHSTFVTKMADIHSGAGGEYHTTYWPQSTFVTDRLVYYHLNYNHYHVLDFKSPTYHEIELWEDVSAATMFIETAPTWTLLLKNLSSFFGRQPLPPKWLYNGAVLGLQGGTEKVVQLYKNLKNEGVEVSAIWIQDWSGNYFTELGSRVYWNWRWNKNLYPNLDKVIKDFDENENVKFLSYINPHVIVDGEMYNEGEKYGYFIKNQQGNPLIINFEMDCATVDLTNPEAYEWYKTILKEMLQLGFGGWMADFGGEYLTVDEAVYFSGEDPRLMHNKYSEMWAKLNREALEEEGKVESTFLFFRSGYGRSPGYATTAWAGDQNVDFSYSDGLASTIPAALSLGMSGMGISHSDIGGYVSAMCMVRNQELLLRWAEMAVFTPIMRTHEGNRPTINWQVYTSKQTSTSFGRLTKIYKMLTPYHSFVAETNSKQGIPAQRPIFIEYPDDNVAYDIKFQYMYGPDLLVAPVLLEDSSYWTVYLPSGTWNYFWNDTEIIVEPFSESKDYKGSNVVVDVKNLGYPPVFYKADSKWVDLFKEIKRNYGYSSDFKHVKENLSWELLCNEPWMFFYLLLRMLFWYLFFNV